MGGSLSELYGVELAMSAHSTIKSIKGECNEQASLGQVETLNRWSRHDQHDGKNTNVTFRTHRICQNVDLSVRTFANETKLVELTFSGRDQMNPPYAYPPAALPYSSLYFPTISTHSSSRQSTTNLVSLTELPYFALLSLFNCCTNACRV